jgi:hypothetical protein
MTSHKSPNKIAHNIIEKCGGFSQAAKLSGATESWVHRWTYTKESGGTGGNVPTKAQKELLKSSRLGLVLLTPADFFQSEANAQPFGKKNPTCERASKS